VKMTPERWEKVGRLFHSALEREGDNRAAYLQQACAGDDALRQEVESLLAQGKTADGLLDDSALGKMAAEIVGKQDGRSLLGTNLGSYQILSLLGVGGMGEVYLAHDSKLRRDVAIKVLPAAFANDPDRLTRFQREARMLASLNHTNIATIYGLEQSDGANYLVMEVVPGQTLAERVKQDGAIPIEEALAIAKQIAEALEAAHEKGIIHRDLKPANVKVTPEGKVKVLDFGLAKAFAGDVANDDPSNSPTLSMAATMHGVILGTAAYMSPEQARGTAVDKRTDIWAFGCVLYELLTGKPAFHGDDVTDILGAVLRMEPNWNRLPAAVPQKTRDLLRRCLQKDRRQRFHDAGDVRIEIDDAIAAPKDSGATQAAPASTSKLLAAAAGALAIVAVVALWVAWRATRPIEQTLRPLVRLDVDLGPDVSLGSIAGADEIISPDGTRIVYVSQGRLFTRRLDQPNTTELAGTQGAYAPFFSPDGQWVAFFTTVKLQKISVEGGPAITLRNASGGVGGSWGEDGNIIAALNNTGGLSRIPSGGGPPTPVTDLQSGEITHHWPQILPGGKAVLFTASATTTAFDTANIEVMSLADHRRKTLVRGGTFGRYLPGGDLVYVNRGTLFAVPFDVERLEVHGTPVPVLDQVGYSAVDGSAQLDFSQAGTLIYRSGGAGGGLLTVAWLDGAGKTQPLLAKPGGYARPSMSPDGQRLALEVADGSGTDIWLYDWQRDTMTRLTFTGNAAIPVWSPDGRYIAFLATGEGMYVIRSDGSGKPQPLTQSKNIQVPWSFAPDGKRLAFHEQDSKTSFDLWTVPLESDSAGLRAGKPEVFLQTPADERTPSFSPDGRWLAYVSDESGTFQVYVRAFPDKGGKWQISNSGGWLPMWSRNGHELFFKALDNHIMVAAYTEKGDSFVADKPRVWSEKQIGGSIGVKNVDLAPDGKRIVALMPVETAEGQKAQNQVIFLENFFDEVRRRTTTQAK
jgi:Tol biopolymer transport system component